MRLPSAIYHFASIHSQVSSLTHTGPSRQCLLDFSGEGTLQDGYVGHCPTDPQGWWTTSLDLKGTDLHVLHLPEHNLPVSMSSLWPLHSAWGTRVTRITKVLAVALRHQHICLYIYLNDRLIVGPCHAAALQALSRTIRLTLAAGRGRMLPLSALWYYKEYFTKRGG